MSGRFQDKVAIVTGSSNGIGRAIAILFAKEGAKVTIHGRVEKDLQETANQIVSAGILSENVVVVKGDLREDSVQKELLQKTLDTFGKLDILINNAGGVGPDMCGRKGFDMNMEDYDYLFDLNLRAVVTLTNICMPHLIKSKGEIIMNSSISALPLATTTLVYYAMTKSALDQYTRALAIQVIRDGVRVNSVNPGVVLTKIFEKQGGNAEKIATALAMDPLIVPAGYYATPQDIAEVVAFLADRKVSHYIVGHCLVVDGGNTLMNKNLNSEIIGLGNSTTNGAV
ncbi:hypothetical protein WR25_12573 [Diploscapter pachys]|uniref:Uncharacterized protein n=1 Tax=Diploscapter pachys TaxID=2018661 RepID=A0A2A2L7Q9_9BILA|nr:hypothetical protein WR25_12573 [Diploscapter pachys]